MAPAGASRVRRTADPKNTPIILIRVFLALVFLFAGSLVVLRRPSAATWAFFIFTLGGGAPVNVSTLVGPVWFQAAMIVVWELSVAVPAFAGPIFALYLLHEGEISRWRRSASWIAGAALLVDVGLICWGVAWLLDGNPPTVANIGSTGLGTLAYVAVPFILGATYVESAPAVRERLRYVIFGFAVFAIVRVIDVLGVYGLTALPFSYFSHSILIALATLAVCSTVVYAVLKHRIIDVNVVMSRAVVYAALSAIIVGLFALVDLFFNRALSHSNAGYIADIGLALILGFFFNTMHRNVDHFVDGLLFRSRHLAERHLTTVLTAIPYAKSEEHVTELVTKEPVHALDLSGALIARTEQMQFTGAASLIAYLEGSHTALRLAEHGTQVDAPIGFEPAVAAPIFSHGDLIAVAFYGFHKNHTDLDQDEVTLLERIASAAGAAYDHLEAQ